MKAAKPGGTGGILAGPSTGGSSATGDQGTRIRDKVRLMVEVVGAVVAIAALIFGVTQATKKEQAQTTVTNQQQTINNFNVANSTLESANASLESVVSSLQAYPGTATVAVTETVTATSSTPTNSGNPGVVRRQGLLVITPGDGARAADLDAQPTDPDWSRTEATGDGVNEGPYMRSTEMGFYSPGDPGLHFLGKDAASYEVCSNFQNYTRESTPIGQMSANTHFCVRTTAGRYAMMTVTKEANPQEIDLDVTVWEKP